jgi:hypothetical protein
MDIPTQISIATFILFHKSDRHQKNDKEPRRKQRGMGDWLPARCARPGNQ